MMKYLPQVTSLRIPLLLMAYLLMAGGMTNRVLRMEAIKPETGADLPQLIMT